MFLRRIEIQGFKSFANKIVLEFESGITAIVGPNGSGKSNVADAVRWVLGEQRVKQLRGDHMQDVIFAGTLNRKPLSYAMVAITLDNSDHALPVDYEEVTVTRRLYRSGESEYLLNGTICRLKDVNELFYDTGIGKEGYSIIGQGQIERIISGRAEERRELFDEAAGIVKYKKRKALTQKKLEDERANLVRVTDILTELEGQLAPLEKEAETAKTYLSKKEELKKYDINLFLVEKSRLQGQIDDFDEKLTLVRTDLSDAQTKYEATKSEYHEIEEQLEDIDGEIGSFREQLNQTNLLKQQLEGRIEVLKEQIHTAELRDEHASARTKTIAEEMKTRKEKLSDLSKEEAELSEKIGIAERDKEDKKVRELSLRNQISELETNIENSRKSLLSGMQSRADKNAELERIGALIEQKQGRRKVLNEELVSSGNNTESLVALIKETADNIGEYEKKADAQKKEKAALENTIQASQKELNDLNGKVKEAESAWNREHSRLESLRSITERYEGYGNSVRRVMERKEREPGIIGVVADVIKTEKKYELAIETALGGSIQNIIVQNEATAKRMVRFLKEGRLGRATFLPLDAVKPARAESETILRETGVQGFAAHLVKNDPLYDGIVGWLLGRIVVVDGIDNALSLARKYQYRLRIVTLDGEALNPGGSISGGAFRNSNNYLSRRRELQDLEQKVTKLQAAYQKIQAVLDEKKKQRADAYHRLDEVNEELHRTALARNTEKLKLETAESRKKEIDSALSDKQAEITRLLSEEKQFAEKTEKLKQEIASFETKETQTKEQSEQDNSALSKAREALSDFLKEVEALTVSETALRQQAAFLKENRDRMETEMSRFEEELASLSENKDSAAAGIRERQAEIEDLEKTIAESGDLYEELNQQIEASKNKKDELNAKHKKFIDKREELSRLVAELDKEQFRLTSRRDNAEASLNEQISYMWEEYEITPVLAESRKDESLHNLAALKKKIQELRSAIRSLGNVNVGAIESFRDVSKRYEFLNTQRNDLIEAEEKLVQIIEELDTGMREQFTVKFAEIQKEFDKVFAHLFGGGKGTLALTEGDDILDAGIIINAQPPGKKLQSIMQLSGGEKSLTAIALLFAIQELKPSPFCLLDEIEAALDDANVNRFASYLELLTKHTQFIIITHRRGTMTAADRLYGITMQEKGISALVSVDFSSLPEDQKQPASSE